MVPKYPSLNRVKVFPDGGGFVNITVLEGGPTATGINVEGGTAKKSCRPPPHRLISATALTEIRDNLARDLRLNGPDLPSLVTINRFIKQEGFKRKKCTRVTIERFTPENLVNRKAFVTWRKTVDHRNLFFVDETGFEDFFRAYGRSPSNCPLLSFALKVKPVKTSVLGVTDFHGVVQAILFDANYTAASTEI